MGPVIVCILIGLVIGFITVMLMKSQLKSVYQRSGAEDYVAPDSLDLHVSTDRYLYENTTRTPKPKSDKK